MFDPNFAVSTSSNTITITKKVRFLGTSCCRCLDAFFFCIARALLP